eukprot:TRINITY_DN4742_c0_g1_i1.p1 TRINITY_DN4742_c0_g1~~TRINITY_DN4742_c0_g1_i1.p1  ORF type:complete len:1315 (+),score=399.91 TRINITY_DN4742_c0_g1_i1:72-3947(+)
MAAAAADSAPTAKKKSEHPEEAAGLFRRLTYAYLNPLLKEGRKRPLVFEDFFPIREVDDAGVLGGKLADAWREQLSGSDPSLLRAVVHAFWWRYFLIGFVGLCEWACALTQPVLAARLMDWNDDPDAPQSEGWILGATFIVIAFLQSYLHHPFFYEVMQAGMRVRIACTDLVFRKMLKLSTASLQRTTTGHLINLVSNDTERFDQASPFLHFIWISCVKAPIVLWMMWRQVGAASLAGFALCLLLCPLQYGASRSFAKLRTETAPLTDHRVKLTSEIVNAARLIKMNAWEKPFSQRVKEARRAEMKKIRKSGLLRALNMAGYFLTTHVINFAVFAIFVATGGELTPKRVFVSMMYVNVLRTSLTLFLPQAVQNGTEALVSLRRMQEFLMLDEFQHSSVDEGLAHAVEFNGVSSRWGQGDGGESATLPRTGSAVGMIAAERKDEEAADRRLTLDSVSLQVKRGDLVAVSGPVGSGKSSLLSAMAGELRCTSGSVRLGAGISLAAQEVWLMSRTVRENILFGAEYDASRYAAVVDACALTADFQQFAHGDETLVGERGVTLSGGQRARVGLARACYHEADMYLLDDPLSAVDTVVGNHLFDRCVRGLLSGKTVVLVTHQHQFLSRCDRQLTLREGRVSETDDASPDEGREQQPKRGCADEAAAQEEAAPGQLVAEDRHVGAVTWRTYVAYFKHGGVLITVVALVTMALAQAAFALTDITLAHWADRDSDDKDNEYFFRHYVSCIAALVILGYVSRLVFIYCALESSRRLHDSMFSAVVSCPVSFFDTNPSGRILNRFSKDIGQMDDLLSWVFLDTVSSFCLVLGPIVIVSVFLPWVLIAVLPLSVVFILTRRFWLSAAREVKRLEAIQRSPLYSLFAEAIPGLQTIRAFGRQQWFVQQFHQRQNDHTRGWYLFVATMRWLGLRLDMMSWLFIAATTLASVAAKDHMSAGSLGVVLTNASTLLASFQWCVRQSAMVETFMTATERVRKYGELPPEPDPSMGAAPPMWPTAGRITINELAVRYRPELPLVLKGLTVTIPGGAKAGVVGRTGAGKSTLLQAMLRMVPTAGGSVVIDGVDLASLSLQQLRSRIAVIPQEPVFFSGSLRQNLDPFGQCSEERCKEALRWVKIPDLMQVSLDANITEQGRNYSVGERQLLCLARAFLRNPKVLVMDEITANVDPETDALIRVALRREFSQCTLLTIAHRLRTIIDYDMIVVMDQGRAAEVGHPHDLLTKRSDGLFARYVDETLPAERVSLRAAAAAAHAARRTPHVDPADDAHTADSGTGSMYSPMAPR